MASKIQVDKISRNSGTPEFTVPTADGTAGQFLKTDGSGVLSFDTVTTNPLTLTGSTNNTIPTITGANALAGEAKEYKRVAMNARREQEALNQYNRNPRRVFDLSRKGEDWRHSVSRQYIEPTDQDMADIGGVPTDLGTINLTNTNTYKMTELATEIFNVKRQQKSFSLQ